MYLIDLDGTMYSGSQVLPGAKSFLAYLQEHQIPYAFLTNNASRTPQQAMEHLLELGFEGISARDFFTSAMAAAKFIASHDTKRKAFYVGMEGLKEALLEEGFELVEKGADFVFIGLDRLGNYDKYSMALDNLLSGAQLVGTNNDRKLPHNGGYKIGNGAVVAMLEYASGKRSTQIGKPYLPILESACEYYKTPMHKMIMIGDNLETDILLGVNANIETIFVTTGVHHEQDCARLGIYPTHTVQNVMEVIALKESDCRG
ncbi:MAG: HAD-IIA family hydrolase [Erysipelotrichaceae bacterium]